MFFIDAKKERAPRAHQMKRTLTDSNNMDVPITFITGNQGKLREVTSILNALGDNFNVVNKNIDLPV